MISVEHIYDDNFKITSIYINLIKRDEMKYFRCTTKELSSEDDDCMVNLDFGKRILEIYKDEKVQKTVLIGVEIIYSDILFLPKVLDMIKDHVSTEEFNKVTNIMALSESYEYILSRY